MAVGGGGGRCRPRSPHRGGGVRGVRNGQCRCGLVPRPRRPPQGQAPGTCAATSCALRSGPPLPAQRTLSLGGAPRRAEPRPHGEEGESGPRSEAGQWERRGGGRGGQWAPAAACDVRPGARPAGAVCGGRGARPQSAPPCWGWRVGARWPPPPPRGRCCPAGPRRAATSCRCCSAAGPARPPPPPPSGPVSAGRPRGSPCGLRGRGAPMAGRAALRCAGTVRGGVVGGPHYRGVRGAAGP